MESVKVNADFVWCCDWGTSSFRLKLVNRKNAAVFYETSGGDGIAKTYTNWTKANSIQVINRKDFFLDIIRIQIRGAERSLGQQVAQLPVIISGMASSSIGIKEEAYAPTPFHLLESRNHLSILCEGDEKWGSVTLISGIATENDVMRGEETQLAGLFAEYGQHFKDRIITCILPGTHSKHVSVADGKITSFKTHLTGELFQLLSEHSILKSNISIPEKKDSFAGNNKLAFQNGVRYAVKNNLLHSLFSTRTNTLLHGIDAEENYFYLSGLLIGYELSTLLSPVEEALLLCCGNSIYPYYIEAIDTLGLKERTTIIPPNIIESSYIFGQLVWTEESK